MKRRLHPKILGKAKNVIQRYRETAPPEGLALHTQTPWSTALQPSNRCNEADFKYQRKKEKAAGKKYACCDCHASVVRR
jgi:hypothetical protein